MRYKKFKCLNCGNIFESYKIYRKVKFCSSICCGIYVRGPYIIKKGYKRVLLWGHPRTDGKGYVREHILIMEKKLGRYVKKKEIIHHVDGNKLNNDPSNLKLFKSQKDHMKYHRSARKVLASLEVEPRELISG